MAELRWILLGLGLLLIAGIWWRGARAGGAASADADLRDPRDGMERDPSRARPDGAAFREPVIGEEFELPPPRERAVPPFEPLTIKTTDLEPLAVVEAPFVAETPILAEPVEVAAAPSVPVRAAPSPVRPASPPVQPAPSPVQPASPPVQPPPRPVSPTVFAPPAPSSPSPASASSPERGDDAQMIVTLRICALGDSRWSGRKLADALEMQGLVHGRYQVFHRHHIDGRSLFSVASLREPGTFDPQTMAEQEFRGITMFAVLPGPLDPVQTVEAMIATSRRLAESLTGMVQDAKGLPLSPQRAAALREEAARFHATLA